MKRLIPDELRTQGAALIIVLAFLVLLTGLVVAYLSRTTTDRQLAHGTYNENRSDILARSALDVIVGDLKQEIALGSSPAAVSGYTIYYPLSPANMLPVVSGTPSPTPTPSSNMIRRSWTGDTGLPVPSRASAVNSATDVSLNGRFITTARWNKHYLIPRLNASSTAIDSSPVATFTAPDWVLVTRGGPTPFPSWNATVKDSTPTNTSYVVGRYAYAIYDEGGMLDVNVAGFPSPAPAPTNYEQVVGRKGSSAYADLTSLPTSTASPAPTWGPARVNQIVGWRNYASVNPSGSLAGNTFAFSAANAQAYMSLVANNNGFLSVASVSPTPSSGATDQAFATRQQLLAFRTASGDTGFSQNVLQYLGTFSRELNRPSWKPAPPSGTPSAMNPDLQSIRVAGAFTRSDGTTAAVAEPLVKTRFALTRINELTSTTNPYIQRDFGLSWDATNSRWNYIGATNPPVSQSRILTLAEVAAGYVLDAAGGIVNAGNYREPNFFEILKAVILNKSVGLGTAGNTFTAADQKYYVSGTNPLNALSADCEIMQIGLNIIDAWDSDNIPTFVNFASYELAGTENLPYLSKIAYCATFGNHGSGQDDYSSWLVPSFWNPHQNASAATGDVRFALTNGSISGTIASGSTTFTTPAIAPIPSAHWIQVHANGFMVPSPPTPATLVSTSTPATVFGTPDGTSYTGFFFGTFPGPNNGITYRNVDHTYPNFDPSPTPSPTIAPSPVPSPGSPTFEMQVLINGQWKAYQKWVGCAQASPTPISMQGISPQAKWKQTTRFDPEFISIDPRTVRFGVWGNDAKTSGNSADYTVGPEFSMDEGGNGMETVTALKPQPAAAFPTTGKTYFYCVNDPNNAALSNDRYPDLDGVIRRADWTTDTAGTTAKKTIMFASPTPAATPLPGATPINSQDRPPVLSPSPSPNSISHFQSVAELGTVFRDQPWKTLNFSTTSSADAGLLDAFTLQDVPMTAGRVSLNTRQSAVLTAILRETIENIADGAVVGRTSTTSPEIQSVTIDLGAIISRLTGLTTNDATAAPMINKAELVTRLMEDVNLNTTLWTKSVSDPFNKESRETVIRAFCDTTQTRTWNLMIDVIAQSGRYPPNATSLANFVVEGEKRYWLHVAIDRFTGEIIDQQLEAVYE